MGIGGSDLYLDSLSLAAALTFTNLDIIIFFFKLFLFFKSSLLQPCSSPGKQSCSKLCASNR